MIVRVVEVVIHLESVYWQALARRNREGCCIMRNMKLVVTDTYDFPTLIGEGYVYVDKTAFRRSLMISTLEQILQGNRKWYTLSQNNRSGR